LEEGEKDIDMKQGDRKTQLSMMTLFTENEERKKKQLDPRMR